MKYLWILLLSIPLFGQLDEHTFTQEEVLGLANKIVSLQADSLNLANQVNILEELGSKYEEHIRTDSLLLVQKDEQIELLMEQNWALEQKADLAKPSWYENKWLYFTYGVAAVTIPTYFGIKIADLAN